MSNNLMNTTPLRGNTIPRRELLQVLVTSFIANGIADFAGATEDAPLKRVTPLSAFSLADVRLLDGPFRKAQQLDAKYLLSLEPDRLLHNFHVNAGLKPKAPVYGGWESQQPWVDIRCHGHSLGHYLSACAMMFAATGEEQYRGRVDYIVTELAACQEAGSSMVCAFPDGTLQLTNSLSGKPFIGVPWYTTHKVLSGLRDAHVFTANQQAVEMMSAMANWIIESSSTMDEAQFQAMLNVEHGGMSEVLADLYSFTNEEQHLLLAERFVHHAVIEPLSAGRDMLDGLHSNTQIPKIIGAFRLYEITGKPEYKQAARFFWSNVTGTRSFATGGNGDGEHFFPVVEFSKHLSSAKTMETCCTHNMLRLTRALFMDGASQACVDYYERALFNGILASQDPDSGMMTYFQPTRPGYLKLYCTPDNSFWCCTGTGMENHAKYGDSIYFHDDSSLYINLFVASELHWKEKAFHITQETQFPDHPESHFKVQVAKPTRLSVKIRHPGWCQQLVLTINGKVRLNSDNPGSYVEIDRIWRKGDVIEVQLPMQLRTQMLPGCNDIAAVMMGPIVLAARMGNEGLQPGADIIVNERTYGDMLNIPMEQPQLSVKDTPLDAKIRRTSKDKLVFRTRSVNPDRELELIPYHRIAHERYHLYWKLV